MMSLIAALEMYKYELFCITLYINEEKSTDTIERLEVIFFVHCVWKKVNQKYFYYNRMLTNLYHPMPIPWQVCQKSNRSNARIRST